jgi:hypothetical protein
MRSPAPRNTVTLTRYENGDPHSNGQAFVISNRRGPVGKSRAASWCRRSRRRELARAGHSCDEPAHSKFTTPVRSSSVAPLRQGHSPVPRCNLVGDFSPPIVYQPPLSRRPGEGKGKRLATFRQFVFPTVPASFHARKVDRSVPRAPSGSALPHPSPTTMLPPLHRLHRQASPR